MSRPLKAKQRKRPLTEKERIARRGELLTRALRWYMQWNEDTKNKPPLSENGWSAETIELYHACRRYRNEV